jgi:hypothetical protein
MALGPTQPPIQWVAGTLSLGVKRPRREADHTPPSSTEVNNAWSYTSTPLYVYMEWCLVKHRDNFTFYLLNSGLLCPESNIKTNEERKITEKAFKKCAFQNLEYVYKKCYKIHQ